MGSEPPDRQPTTSADKSSQALFIPRWAVIAALLILLLPVLIMLSMMLVMGWLGPPMHGRMTVSAPSIVPGIGVIPLLLVLGVIYGMYRLFRADTT